MKKIYTHYLLLLLFTFTASQATAQTAQGCDGARYYNDVFDEVEMSTVYYGTNSDAAGNSFDLEMDIYQPVGDTQEKRPLMIWSHGGAFVGGDRTNMTQNCIDFAKKGFVTATISYRLYPVIQLGIPDSIEMMDAAMKSLGDLKAAIRHFYQDADTDNLYRIDTDYIVVAGVSAGAIMAVHAAYLDEDDNIPDFIQDVFADNGGMEGSTGDAANQSYPSDVVAAINLSGALHKREWMSPGEPPLASYHGTADDVVPYNHGVASVFGFDFMSLDGSGVMHQRADELGIFNFHIAAEGAGHDTAYQPDYADDFAQFNLEGLDFLQTVLCSPSTNNNEVDLAVASVSVYPNPTSTDINLELSNYTGGYTINLFDQTSRRIHSYAKLYEPFATINASKLPKGLYYLEVAFEDGTIAPVVKKVVVE